MSVGIIIKYNSTPQHLTMQLTQKQTKIHWLLYDSIVPSRVYVHDSQFSLCLLLTCSDALYCYKQIYVVQQLILSSYIATHTYVVGYQMMKQVTFSVAAHALGLCMVICSLEACNYQASSY